MIRPVGYYWVNYIEDLNGKLVLEPALWDGHSWQLIGFDDTFGDDDCTPVGAQMVVPGEKNPSEFDKLDSCNAPTLRRLLKPYFNAPTLRRMKKDQLLIQAQLIALEQKPGGSHRIDSDLLNWLQDEQVDTIYMDDGRIIEVKSGNLRAKIREACDRADAEADAEEQRAEQVIEDRDEQETGADRCPPRE